MLRSTQRALRQAKQELADTQRKLKHGAHGEADQQNAPPQPVHNLSAAELRQRLEDMSRALSASPEHLVQAIQQVDELREFATQTAQGIRDIAGVPRPTRRQTSKTAPIEPDWDVLGLLTQIRHSFAATVDEHTVQGATLDYISARLKEALSSGPSVQDIDAEVGAVVQAGAVEAMEPQDSKPATATEVCVGNELNSNECR